jgi:hypothetical protein
MRKWIADSFRFRFVRRIHQAIALILVGLSLSAPGLPGLVGLPVLITGPSNNSTPFSDEEDEHGPAKAKTIATAAAFAPRNSRPQGAKSSVFCPSWHPHSTSGLSPRALYREPADHFRNGLGAPRLC